MLSDGNPASLLVDPTRRHARSRKTVAAKEAGWHSISDVLMKKHRLQSGAPERLRSHRLPHGGVRADNYLSSSV